MVIILNGEERTVADGATAATLIEELGLAGRRIAMEVNREIVPRGTFESHALGEGDKVEIVQSERQKLEFSYMDQTGYHFMDTTTYDTITFQEEFVEDVKDLLIDALEVEILFVDGKPVTIEMPSNVELEVTESAPGVKGDTATAATKEATLETGLIIQVPLFIGPGDKVKVSSEDKKYVGRA